MGTLGCIHDMMRRDKENRELRRRNRERMKETRRRMTECRHTEIPPTLSVEKLEKIKKQTQLNGAKVANIDVNFKTWDLKKIEKYFGEDPLVRELTELKFGCDISPED